MTDDEGNTRYIVDEKVLPMVLLKTIEAKELLKKGEANTIYEAVEKVGMSRSAYYKYKDYIFPLYEIDQGKIITIHLLLSHDKGVLAQVLDEIAKSKASILTINQSIPIHGVANVTMAIEIEGMTINIDGLLSRLRKIEGVNDVSLLARE
ncbi:MAG: ACT domain-containing protein [Tissierellia bacterium]|nr:ACT domain-containing protein [Tissierellia bacterium]